VLDIQAAIAHLPAGLGPEAPIWFAAAPGVHAPIWSGLDLVASWSIAAATGLNRSA
jgi:hypothetical protein